MYYHWWYFCISSFFWLFVITTFKKRIVCDLHAVPCVILSILSIYDIIPDEITWAWSLGYFVVDGVDVFDRGETIMAVHHGLTTLLCIGSILEPQMTFGTHTTPYFLLVEISGITLSYWEYNRESLLRYMILIVSYFFNRVVWVAYLMYFSFISRPDTTLGYVVVLLARLMHILMCVWYTTLLKKVKNYII